MPAFYEYEPSPKSSIPYRKDNLHAKVDWINLALSFLSFHERQVFRCDNGMIVLIEVLRNTASIDRFVFTPAGPDKDRFQRLKMAVETFQRYNFDPNNQWGCSYAAAMAYVHDLIPEQEQSAEPLCQKIWWQNKGDFFAAVQLSAETKNPLNEIWP